MNQDKKILYHIAALLYNSKTNNIKRDNVLRKIIESILAFNGNRFFTCVELFVEIKNKVNLIVVEDEIEAIITNEKNRGFAIDYCGPEIKVCLKKERYEHIMNQNKHNIEFYIKEFIQIKRYSDDVKNLLEQFLYYFYCKNVNDIGGMIGDITKINIEEFSPDEVQIIQEFIEWENDDKNELLLAIANYALEYLLISGNNDLKDKKDLKAVFSNKRVYIDTNIIFYCLGINGSIHEEANKVFLQKCKDCNEQIVISYYTNKEFLDTLEHFIGEIDRWSSPLIYNKKINNYMTNKDIYNYYITWANKQNELKETKYFKKFILDKYEKLIEMYSIKVENKEPFSQEVLEKNEVYHLYEESVPNNSGTSYDAKNIFYVESKRTVYETDLQKARDIFVSAHKDLQRWDGRRERSTAPVVVAPNLWLLLLARLVSRNDEDIKCFISYINLANREIIISNKEYLQVVKILNDIIDDVEYQESVLAVMVDEEFAFLNNGDEKRTSTFIEERTKERAYAILEDRILKLEKDNAEYIKKLDSFTEENIELQTVVIQQNQKISEQLQALHSVEVLNEKQRNDSYVVYNNLVEENKKLKENVEIINRRRKNNKIVMLILIFFVINIFAIKEFLDIFTVKKNNPLTYSLFTRLVRGSVCEYESQAEQYWNWLYFFGNAIIIVIDYKIIKGIYKIIKGDNEKN